jgi:APA family basic amino acid/polyamine antiporter
VKSRPELEQSMGIVGATGVGVGAIVGGGILALSGVAFAATGPAAVLAFALNGLIALVTALSFAALATRFPESGGTYAFAKKVLSIEAAFVVGWVVWFASIVASTLYAFGFGAFVLIAVEDVASALDAPLPAWLESRWTVVALAVFAVGSYALGLLRRATGGGQWVNVGKVAVFGLLIAAGLWKLVGTPPATIGERLSPFFTEGTIGLVAAMGYTFIAWQGFDLIAAVGGEIREPVRTIPRAMLSSLGIAALIYLPLLLIIATIGVPGGRTVAQLGAEEPAAVVALAAENYLGGFGYWLVIVAGVLSMLSALQANLLAASRVGMAMARDRTLPDWIEFVSPTRRTPTAAVLTTAALVVAVLLIVPDLAGVGAASSLVFLVTFAIAHRMSILARRRGSARPVFSFPGLTVLSWLGIVACVGLAMFEGITVPSAGTIACAWIAIGGVLYVSALRRRARTVDAFRRALDADLVRLRGRSPLVLVPIANPANAEAMVGVAHALAPPVVGRVILLSVVTPPDPAAELPGSPSLVTAQAVLHHALTASFERAMAPEVLTTVSVDPWHEILRVARVHRCESLLLGLSRITEEEIGSQVEKLIGRTPSDVVVLRAPEGWLLRNAKRVLVPIRGRHMHNELRARLLGSIWRLGAREISLLRVVPGLATDLHCAQARQALERTAEDEVPHASDYLVTKNNDVVEAIAEHATACDLLVLGLRRRTFGDMALRIADRTTCAIVMISRRE